MLIERIESEGLAHYSYMLGYGTRALVIDPRRDCGVYVTTARRNNMSIKYILETHRNEDYVSGSRELAAATGAEIWHADSQLDYSYGDPAEEGQTWELGPFEVRAISTPGHTPGSMSYILSDEEGHPWICFTGDALFAGDAGRVDLMGMERADGMARMLYRSIFGKLLPLGDGVIVCPAHGPGSVCGSGIVGRTLTTVGMERQHNPRLQAGSEEEFADNIMEELERPPYFRTMERLNVEGPPVMGGTPLPPPMSPAEFHGRMERAVVVDTRQVDCFASAHIPGSLSIWTEGLAGLAGWYLQNGEEILLLTGGDTGEAARMLFRMGYDDLVGYLPEGILSWHMAGLESSAVGTVTVGQLCGILDDGEEPAILDVRSRDELEEDGSIPDALHIHVTRLPERYGEVPDGKTLYIFCGSGNRSMTAASFLRRKGYDNIRVVLGGLSGWNSASCHIDLGET